MKSLVLLIGLFLLVIFSFALWPTEVFTFRLAREEERLIEAVRVGRGDEIRLTYRHSVEGTEVEGRFVVTEGPSLLLKETRMASVGTGLPTDRKERTRRDGKWLVVDEGGLKMEGLRFFYLPLNRPRFMVAGHEVALDPLPPGSLLRLGVERVGNWRWLLWKVFKRPWQRVGSELP